MPGASMRRRQRWRKAQVGICPHCDYCNKRLTLATATVDHIHPKHAHGGHTWRNYALACETCQQRKANKFLEQVGMVLLRRRHESGLMPPGQQPRPPKPSKLSEPKE